MTTFPLAPVTSGLPPSEIARLAKMLMLHQVFPLPYPLHGEFFEHLFADAVGGEQKAGKSLFDVVRGETGWSLKTLQLGKMTPGTMFRLVVKRCDILADRSLALDIPVEMLGQHITDNFNSACIRSSQRQGVHDPRAAYLLHDRAHRQFVFFQQRYRLYEPAEVQWQWAPDGGRSLVGFVGGEMVWRWYRSGTQLFGLFRIPVDAQRFTVDWKRADLDETAAFFSSQGLATLEISA